MGLVEGIQANKYEHKKEQNVKFPEFFIVNQSDTDSIQYFKTRIVPLENDILKTKSKFLTVDESRNYIIRIGLFLLIITFGVRYSYYATRWSILTIKSRE